MAAKDEVLAPETVAEAARPTGFSSAFPNG